jgi:HlyD family secretion protein
MAIHFAKKHLFWFALGGLLLFFFYLGFRTPAQLVDLVEVKRGYFAQTFTEEGKTRVKDRYLVAAPVTGFLERVDLEAGDHVAVGDRLFTLRPNPSAMLDSRSRAQAEAGLAAAEASLKTALSMLDAQKATLNFAQAEHKRLAAVAREGFVAQDRLDQAVNQLRNAEASARSAEFQVQVARHQRDNAAFLLRNFDSGDQGATHITAPVSGVILKRLRESAGVMSAGEPVMEIADIRSLEVEVDVLSADAVRLQPGMPVVIEHWGGEIQIHGSVKRIEPGGFTKYSALGVEEQRVWVIVEFSPEQNEHLQHLGDGYRVEATFILWQADNVLQVASSALVSQREEIFVYRVLNDRAEKVTVTTGRRSGLWVEIQKGVEAGDLLVSHPGDDLEEGSKVKTQ